MTFTGSQVIGLCGFAAVLGAGILAAIQWLANLERDAEKWRNRKEKDK